MREREREMWIIYFSRKKTACYTMKLTGTSIYLCTASAPCACFCHSSYLAVLYPSLLTCFVGSPFLPHLCSSSIFLTTCLSPQGVSLSSLWFPEPAVPSDRDQAGNQRGNVIAQLVRLQFCLLTVYWGPFGNQWGNVGYQLVRLHFRLIEIQLVIKEVMLDIS